MCTVLAADLDSPDVMVFPVPDSVTELSNSEQPADSDKGLLEVRFAANNDETVRVECACLRVKLEWSVQPMPGSHLSDREIRVVLVAGGQKVSDELPLKGEYEVAEDHTVVYEIRAGRGEVWRSKRVEVRRYPSLYRPSPKSRGSVFIGAQITCSAPEEGLGVELSSSLGGLSEREVYIAPGDNRVPPELRFGNKGR